MPLAIPPTLPDLTTVTQRFRLEQLSQRHYGDIASILGDDRVWEQGFGTDAQRPLTDEDRLAFIDSFIRAEGRSIFAVVHAATGEAIGTTGIAKVLPEVERVQIGRTLISPLWWGGGLNHEVKLTFIDWLFGCGAGRVECDVDAINQRSARSLLSFGFTPEGVRRRSSQRSDGSWRDIQIFSILREEWEEVRLSAAVPLLERHERSLVPA